MIVTLDEVKQYLRLELDFTDDNNSLITLIGVAEEYLKNATGKDFTDTNKLAKIFVMTIVGDLYDNRNYTVDKVSEKVRFTINSILTQLQNCYDEVVS